MPSDPDTNPVGTLKEIVDQLRETYFEPTSEPYSGPAPFRASYTRLPFGITAHGDWCPTKKEAERSAARIALDKFIAMAADGRNAAVVSAVHRVVGIRGVAAATRAPFSISTRLASRVVNILIDAENAHTAPRDLLFDLDTLLSPPSASIRIHAFVSDVHHGRDELVALAASRPSLCSTSVVRAATMREAVDAFMCVRAGLMAASAPAGTVFMIVSRDLVLQALARVLADAAGATGNRLVTVGCSDAAGVRAWLADPQL
jgi:hypothetical protein